MKAVSRFEADLLRLLHALLGRAPLEGALPVLLGRRERPPCLGREAVALVQDTLARGCVWRLARDGGWRPARHLQGDRIASGRLWERTPPADLGLAFSGHSLEFLIGLVASPPDDPGARGSPPGAGLTVADRLLLYFAFEALRATEAAGALLRRPAFRRHGLIALAFPDDLARHGQAGPPDLAPWVVGVGACVLEALQPRLAARWVAIERGKGRIADAAEMAALGAAQEAALDALLGAVDAANRRDLARFLLEAAAELLRDRPPARAWIGRLELGGLRLSERSDLHRAALAYLRRLEQLRRWEREARTVGYFDEGYAAAQLAKADWDALGGDDLCDRAGAILRELDPLARPSIA